jgi:hypothetical protein
MGAQTASAVITVPSAVGDCPSIGDRRRNRQSVGLISVKSMGIQLDPVAKRAGIGHGKR